VSNDAVLVPAAGVELLASVVVGELDCAADEPEEDVALLGEEDEVTTDDRELDVLASGT
jgi:hypothetical protein